MTKTATVHNPVHFDPADYEIQDYLDNKSPQYFGQGIDAYESEVAFWKADMIRVFGVDYAKKIHHCVHCGNGNVRWITAVLHLPTKDVVVFGCDCTERLGFANRQDWKLAQLKSKAEAGHARMKVWKQRVAFLDANPDVQAVIDLMKDPAHAGNTFVADVLRKLDRYGSLSVNQVNALRPSLQRDLDRAARVAADAVEVKGDAPEGRVEVTGVVLTIKAQASDFAPGGFQTKMLMKLANNSKVWLTAPLGTDDYHTGDTIVVRASFERSRDDRSFAFGKRPHFVRKIEGGVQ